MSQQLDALTFPLHGSRLIEASAGTGKTWTIAALYLRLVLGHGGEQGFGRPLLPSEILVMTFTNAATRELSNRVRERLVQAAAYFRGAREADDPYLRSLAAGYADERALHQAAHRLALAAEAMDDAAIFTIDAWCQRMLREHAFDSASLFDEELVSDERALFEDAANDYWRQQVYPLDSAALAEVRACWDDVNALKNDIRRLLPHRAALGAAAQEPLAALVARHKQELARLKDGWGERVDQMERWIAGHRERDPKCLHGSKLRADYVAGWFTRLRAWAADPALFMPDNLGSGWTRLSAEGISAAFMNNFSAEVPDCFGCDGLRAALDKLGPLKHALMRHAVAHVSDRIQELKRRGRQYGFADMLDRLKEALEGQNGEALRRRIGAQFPVALIDEFQDTSPSQYRIFDLLYDVAAPDAGRGLFLIGDPKQSIYGFRGADIHSYLAARAATAGRHYQLGTNYRSARALVAAVNRLFLYAEGDATQPGYAAGAFRFRKGDLNPLPFDEVAAHGRAQELVGVDGPYQALAVCCTEQGDLGADDYRRFFAHHCAEHIVRLLNDERVGFRENGELTRLAPADIAILVRDRYEADAIRRALQQREVRSVYLSDKDSVFRSQEASDVLRWLQAVANPLDGTLARAAFATATAGLSLAELARLMADEMAWEERVEQLKALHATWQRQGVLAMLRRFIHELGLPARLLREAGGERRLTNLLHLAELLQAESGQLEGEQAMVRWFAEQLAEDSGGDERVLRLESDADLVKVVTVHKSKGLEYPLVYLPFAVTARSTTRRNRKFFEYVDEQGTRRVDLALGDAAKEAAERARIEEDLRLLYVALTRARHFLWLGVAALPGGKDGKSILHQSALGYLLTGGEAIDAGALRTYWERLRGATPGIELHMLAAPDGSTRLRRAQSQPQLVDPPAYTGRFERDWTVGSFTSLARHAVAAPTSAQDETLLEEEQGELAPGRTDDAPWHRFPRGSTPGNFLHAQLEWMAGQGFDCIDAPGFESRLAREIERAGWANRQDDAIAWLRTIVATRLPPLGAALAQVAAPLAEMEFWFPSEKLDVAALDQLCRERLLGKLPRAQLPRRELHGMLKGFADLVFEHEGRYWVLDYKSNALGPGDGAYTRAAMNAAMAAHRYDIQGAIYMLALHRLLRSRLGAGYDPARQLGGAIFLFLRGIANPSTHGCCLLEPDLVLLDGIDRLLANHPTDEA